jgi:hypothetical protein
MATKFNPEREIKFAVKVGFLTKSIWQKYFATDYQERWRQMIWKRFLEDGYFLRHEAFAEIYYPNPKHRDVIAAAPYIAKPPNMNQFVHDEIVATTYLMLLRKFNEPAIKTEALLKREVPVSNKGLRIAEAQKHPDLSIDLGNSKVAIEIELTQKSRSRYTTALRNYRQLDYANVIYVIRSSTTKNVIESAADGVSFPRNQIGLGFASLGQWKIDPVTAPIHFDGYDKTLMTMR